MAWISAVFFCLGAADTLLGDRLGLGSAFRQGFAAVVDLLLLIVIVTYAQKAVEKWLENRSSGVTK